jgi:hypothetical protein
MQEAQDEPHVSVGRMLEQAILGKDQYTTHQTMKNGPMK